MHVWLCVGMRLGGPTLFHLPECAVTKEGGFSGCNLTYARFFLPSLRDNVRTMTACLKFGMCREHWNYAFFRFLFCFVLFCLVFHTRI